jgi:hypothetical protein
VKLLQQVLSNYARVLCREKVKKSEWVKIIEIAKS